MGHTRIRDSDRGARVLGIGKSPSTGKPVQGRAGTVKRVRTRFGEDIVSVRWDGDSADDDVRQENVSGTRMV